VANIKSIDLAIKGVDLASKPLTEIGEAIDKLVTTVETLVPASEKGEKKLSELTAAAGDLKKTLQSLKADQANINTVQSLVQQIEALGTAAAASRTKADELAQSVSKITKNTKDNKAERDAAKDAERTAKAQETQLARLQNRLATASDASERLGVDTNNLADSQAKVDAEFERASNALLRTRTAIDGYSEAQKRARAEADELAAAEKEANARRARDNADIAIIRSTQAKIAADEQRAIDAEELRLSVEKRQKEIADIAAVRAVQKAFVDAEIAESKARKDREQADVQAIRAVQKQLADDVIFYAARKKKEQDDLFQVTLIREKLASDAAKKAAKETSDAQIKASKLAEEAQEQHTKAVEKAREGFSLFNDSGRTTLSLFQRLRGELLSMTAEFIGFYGVIEQFKSGFEDIEKLEGVKSILSSTFGEEGVAGQLAFVQKETDRLKLSFIDTAQDYAKLAAAGKANGLSQEDVRSTFTAFAEAARVKQLTTEQTTELFGGLAKVFERDQVAAGQLFRQLGQQLPELAGKFRDFLHEGIPGLPYTNKQFEELLSTGQVTAEDFARFARSFKESFDEQLPQATRTAGAAIKDFQNAFGELRREVLEGGTLDAITDAFTNLAMFLRSEDGKTFVKILSAGLSDLTQALVFITEHLKEFSEGIAVVGAAWLLHIVGTVAGSLPALGRNLGLLIESFRGTKVAAAAAAEEIAAAEVASAALASTITLALETALIVIAGAFAAFKISEYFYDEFPAVRVFCAQLVAVFDDTVHEIKDLFTIAFDSIFDPTHLVEDAQKAFEEAKQRALDHAKAEKSAGRPNGSPAEDDIKDFGVGADNFADETADALARAQIAKEAKEEDEQKTRDANQERLDGLLDKQFKGLDDKVSNLSTEILKKTASDLDQFNTALNRTISEITAEADKLRKDNPQDAAAARYERIVEGLKKYAALARQDFTNQQNEKSAQRDLGVIQEGLKEQQQTIADINKDRERGDISELNAKMKIQKVTNEGNAAARDQIENLKNFIESLPINVQVKLDPLFKQLRELSHGLVDDTSDQAVAIAKDQAKELTAEIQKRNAAIEVVEAKRKAGLIDGAEELKQTQAIDAKYGDIVKQALAYVNYLRESPKLTADQKKNLEETANALELIAVKAKIAKDDLLTQAQVTEDLAAGGVKIGDAFAKAVGQTHSLSKGFKDAQTAFRQFASDFLLQIGEMILKQTLLNALGQGGPGSSITGGIASAVSGLFNSSVGSVAASAATSSTAGTVAEDVAGLFHSGGMAGYAGPSRKVMASWFENAPRYHTGGVVGLNPNEVPAILQRGEEVLSKADQRNRANGGGSSPQHIQVVNAIDHESVVRQGLQSPSNTKVILNLIRANRTSVKAALA